MYQVSSTGQIPEMNSPEHIKNVCPQMAQEPFVIPEQVEIHPSFTRRREFLCHSRAGGNPYL
jgi:hypothetical protein